MTFTQIKNRVYRLTGTNSSSFTDSAMAEEANLAMDHIASLINLHDSLWNYEDTNQTDLPIGKTTITSGQQDYGLSTTHLSIDRVEVKDTSGKRRVLDQIDQQLLKGDRKIALSEYKSGGGVPEEYDILGNSIFLYPTPNYTQVESLYVYFTRGPVAFTSADTSAVPGFPSIFHDLVPLWIAYNYGLSKVKGNADRIFVEIQRKEKELISFYQLRNRDIRHKLEVSVDSNK